MKILRILIGLAAAILVTAIPYAVVLSVIEATNIGASLTKSLLDVIAVLIMTTIITIKFSAASAALLILTGEFLAFNKATYYILAGLITAACGWSLVIFNIASVPFTEGLPMRIDPQNPWDPETMVLLAFAAPCGALSGYVYWLIAGRHAGMTKAVGVNN